MTGGKNFKDDLNFVQRGVEHEELRRSLGDGCVGVEVIPDIVAREIRLDRCSSLLKDRADQQGGTNQELLIDAEGSGIRSELEQEGSGHGLTQKGGIVEEGVVVGEQAISHADYIGTDCCD